MNLIKAMKTASQFFQRLGLLLGATTFLFNAWAQNQATLTPIGKWPGYPMPLMFPVSGQDYAIKVVGSYAYLAGCGPSYKLRLIVLDVSTPAQPRYLSHLDTEVNMWQNQLLCVRSNYAYVASNAGALAVIDVSQPAAPELAGTCQFSVGIGHGMCLEGKYLYLPGNSFDPVAYHNQGFLLVLDVGDPANPVVHTTVPVSVDGFVPAAVAVAGDYLYAAGHVRPSPQAQSEFDYVHLDIINISDPGFPFVTNGHDKPVRLYPRAICAQGGLLHLAYWGNEVPSVYEVFDLSDPLNPSPLGSYALLPTEYINSLRLLGNLAYLTSSDLTSSAGLRVLDFSDPRNLRLIAFIRSAVNWGWGGDFDLAGEYGYWDDQAGELQVLQLTNPAAPRQVAVFETAFSTPQLSVEGDRAYLLEADSKRFHVLDVSNPHAPILVARSQLTNAGPFKVVGQRGYVATGSLLQILDLSDPSQPRQAGWFSAPSAGVDVVGTRAYVTGSSPANRLTIIEATNPAAPVRLGYLNLPGTPGPPQVVGNYAYCPLYDSGDLMIIDVRDPSHMAEVGRYHSTNGLGGFQVAGQYAHVLVNASEERSLHVVSLVNPANPTRVGQYVYDPATVNDLRNLYVSGRYAFVVLSEGGTNRLDMLDMANPAGPAKAGEYYPGCQISGFAMVGNTLYASSDAGLTVLNFFDPNSPLRLNVPVLSGNLVTLSWAGGPGIKLQKATRLTNPDWQDVPGTDGVSQIELPRTNAAAFFRLFRP